MKIDLRKDFERRIKELDQQIVSVTNQLSGFKNVVYANPQQTHFMHLQISLTEQYIVFLEMQQTRLHYSMDRYTMDRISSNGFLR